jgi:hypothetical protein
LLLLQPFNLSDEALEQQTAFWTNTPLEQLDNFLAFCRPM